MLNRNSIYTELFQAYYHSLENFCISRGVQPDNVEDIVVEAFTRALEKSDQFLALAPNQQKTWLFSAAMYIIKESRVKKPPIFFSEVEGIENYINSDDSLAAFQTDQEYEEYAKQVYGELATDKEREVFRLMLDDKLDYRLLSENYGLSSGAARVMISRFRKKLREIITKII